MPARRRRAARALPRVQADVVVVAAGREERGLSPWRCITRSRARRGRTRASDRDPRPSGGRGRCLLEDRCSRRDDSAPESFTKSSRQGRPQIAPAFRRAPDLRAPGRRAVEGCSCECQEDEQQRLNAGRHRTPPFRAEKDRGMRGDTQAASPSVVNSVCRLTLPSRMSSIGFGVTAATRGAGRDDWRAAAAASSRTQFLATRAVLAWGFVRVHLADRGRCAAALGESAPQARPEARRLGGVPRDGLPYRDADVRELRLVDAELALGSKTISSGAEATLEPFPTRPRIRRRDRPARARIALGFSAARRGDDGQAVVLLEAASRRTILPGDQPDLYGTLGSSYAALGAPGRAVELFEHCLDELGGSARTRPRGSALRPTSAMRWPTPAISTGRRRFFARSWTMLRSRGCLLADPPPLVDGAARRPGPERPAEGAR